MIQMRQLRLHKVSCELIAVPLSRLLSVGCFNHFILHA